MKKCKINVINEIETNALTEEEIIKIFNKKLSSIIMKLEETIKKENCTLW